MQENLSSKLSSSSFTIFNDSSSNEFITPELPALNACLQAFKNNDDERTQKMIDWSRVVIIGQQHFLETTVTLIEKIIALGVQPENIHLADKIYSSNKKVRSALTSLGVNIYKMPLYDKAGDYEKQCLKTIKKIFDNLASYENNPPAGYIILDDGGYIPRKLPTSLINGTTPIARIEQTRGGLYNPFAESRGIPTINIAQSSLKKDLEPVHIATAISNQLNTILSNAGANKENSSIGIIGYGTIGKALTQKLLEEGYTVTVYDESKEVMKKASEKVGSTTTGRLKVAKDAQMVIANSSHIIGCTGTDITSKEGMVEFIENLYEDKCFFNVGSGDIEYRNYIKVSQKNSKIVPGCLNDISVINQQKKTIKFAYGGFPINFANSAEQTWNVPAFGIEETQCALFGGVLQAAENLQKQLEGQAVLNDQEHNFLMLDPYYQAFAATEWFKAHPEFEKLYPEGIVNKYKNLEIEAIKKNSVGKFVESEFFQAIYAAANTVQSKVANF